MALIQTVHLSMANFKSAPVVPAVQNDTDRQLKMIIDDYTLTSGLTGKIAFERSDGTHYETAAELVLADNAFTADIDQALTQPGRTMVQLKVTDVNTVSTFSFVVFVEADNSGTVTPQEGIDLVTAVEAAEDAADRAEEAASMFEDDVPRYVYEWLDGHPEATTTVLDGSLTESKFSDALKLKTIKDYVTPEMFGAVGDGVTDDTTAIQSAIDSGYPVLLSAKVYKINSAITITKPVIIRGSSSQRLETNRPQLDFSSITGNAINISVQGVVIDDVNFYGNRTNTVLFSIVNAYRLTLNRCGIYKFNKGIYTDRAWNIGINNCIFEFCERCIDLNGVNTSISVVGTNFYHSTYGIVSNTGLDYSSLYACGFDTCDTCIQLESSYANNLSLVSCGFEGHITGVYCKGYSYCVVINPTFVNTARTVEAYAGLGKIIVIGGRTDNAPTPNKNDVLYIGTVLNSNANVICQTIGINEKNNSSILNGNVYDYVYPISNGTVLTINFDPETTFDVGIDVCSTEYPESFHFTKESSIIAKTQGTFATFDYAINRDNGTVTITFKKGGNIHVKAWFKNGGSIS